MSVVSRCRLDPSKPEPPAGVSAAGRASASRRGWLGLAAGAVCAPVAGLGTGLGLGGTPAAVLAAPASAGRPLPVEGAGASFPSRVWQTWAERYAAATGQAVSYRPTGSGDGLQRISARQVDFAGSDAPLGRAELERRRLQQWPMLIGGIAPVAHLPELGGRALRVDGPTLARLMLGEIRRWDDPALQALNPGLALPPRTVARVVRADRSGTTEAYSRYLATALPAFAAGPGVGTLPAWGPDVQPATGNDGLLEALRARAGTLGYVSHDRLAEAPELTALMLRNRAGQWRPLDEAGLRQAVLASAMHREGQDTASLLDLPGEDVWPLTLASHVLVDARPAQRQRASATLSFLYWCLQRGDAVPRRLGFAPLPVVLQARLAERFMAIVAADGQRPDYVRE